MPQLDKYIFFNHVISFTAFFSLIYLYLRKHVVPEVSSILKFRRKKLTNVMSVLTNYEKGVGLSKTVFEKKSKYHINSSLIRVNSLISLFKKFLSKQMLVIYVQGLKAVKRYGLTDNFYFKNKKESNRFVKSN